MGVWVEILKRGAEGDAEGARDLLYGRLPLELLTPPARGAGSSYTGPLPHAVAGFVGKLPADEQRLARFYQDELLDYIIDDITTGVEKPLLLAELCHARPGATFDEMVSTYPWEEGLKRSPEWKRQWIADMLQSMRAAGVPLPASVLSWLGGEGEAKYEFNEVKFALKKQRLEFSWNDFKKKQGLDSTEFFTLLDSEEAEGVEAEAVSFGTIGVAEVVLRSKPEYAHETLLSLVFLGRELSPELAALVEEMHAAKPGDGCKPISWHNVFWYLISEYQRLQLSLDARDPFHEEDEPLASYIAANYDEVKGSSRSTIRRRRLKILGACEEQIHARLREKLG